MVRTLFVENLKHYTLDTLIAVGDSKKEHGLAELFSLTSLKWQATLQYPYAPDIYGHSILAVEKKFILFGGWSVKRKVSRH